MIFPKIFWKLDPRQTVPYRWPGVGKIAVTELVAWSLRSVKQYPHRGAKKVRGGVKEYYNTKPFIETFKNIIYYTDNENFLQSSYQCNQCGTVKQFKKNLNVNSS